MAHPTISSPCLGPTSVHSPRAPALATNDVCSMRPSHQQGQSRLSLRADPCAQRAPTSASHRHRHVGPKCHSSPRNHPAARRGSTRAHDVVELGTPPLPVQKLCPLPFLPLRAPSCLTRPPPPSSLVLVVLERRSGCPSQARHRQPVPSPPPPARSSHGNRGLSSEAPRSHLRSPLSRLELHRSRHRNVSCHLPFPSFPSSLAYPPFSIPLLS